VAKAKYLFIGSTANCSGKTATILGITQQLQQKGIALAYGKPLGRCINGNRSEEIVDEDVRFIATALNLSENQVKPPLLSLDDTTIAQRLQQNDSINRSELFQHYCRGITADLTLLEGPGSLSEGRLFNLSINQMANALDASVLLVTRCQEQALLVVDELLAAKKQLGDRLVGVFINDIPHKHLDNIQTLVQPFLESQGIPVLGMLPHNSLLNSVSVRELTQQLRANVLCRRDRLDLMVESLVIGAMNVNSALEYFRKGRNMAVVTGADRPELQLSALETSTNCLILTGHSAPQDFILQRAEDLEIPILSVDLDTLTTVEIADRAFGNVRLQESIKVECIQHLMQDHFDVERLLEHLGLNPAFSAS
jgi:BioD-like phosphotransacetylase family protein